MKVAYLNNDGTIGAIGRIGDNAVLNEKMIQIDENFDTTNKKWNGSDWESYTPEPVPEPEPSQLDRIEEAVTAKNQDIAQAAIDTYTLELIEGGIL